MIDRVICTDEQKKALTTSSIGRRVLRKVVSACVCVYTGRLWPVL